MITDARKLKHCKEVICIKKNNAGVNLKMIRGTESSLGRNNNNVCFHLKSI